MLGRLRPLQNNEKSQYKELGGCFIFVVPKN